jgi:hypothetical protein
MAVLVAAVYVISSSNLQCKKLPYSSCSGVCVIVAVGARNYCDMIMNVVSRLYSELQLYSNEIYFKNKYLKCYTYNTEQCNAAT